MERKLIFTKETYTTIYDILCNFFLNDERPISYDYDGELHLISKFICAYVDEYRICICSKRDVYGKDMPVSINQSIILNIGDEINVIDNNMIEININSTEDVKRHSVCFKKIIHNEKETESVNDKLDRIFGLVKELDVERKECILKILDNSYKLTSTKK